jgi:hypothetical protein
MPADKSCETSSSVDTAAPVANLAFTNEKSAIGPLFAAYVAGFFDGEGCITFSVKRTRTGDYERVTLTFIQNHRGVLEMIQTVFGGNIYESKPSSIGNGGCHRLQIAAQVDVHRCLTAMLPHLVVKQAKAVEALTLIGPSPRSRQSKRLNPVTHCKHGHEFTPENTRVASDGRRSCLTCDREAWRMKQGHPGRERGPYRRAQPGDAAGSAERG